MYTGCKDNGNINGRRLWADDLKYTFVGTVEVSKPRSSKNNTNTHTHKYKHKPVAKNIFVYVAGVYIYSRDQSVHIFYILLIVEYGSVDSCCELNFVSHIFITRLPK